MGVLDMDELKIMRNLPTGALDPGSLEQARVSLSPLPCLGQYICKEELPVQSVPDLHQSLPMCILHAS